MGVTSLIHAGAEAQRCAEVARASTWRHAQRCSVQLRCIVPAVESFLLSYASKSLQKGVALQGRRVATGDGKRVFYLMIILCEINEHMEQRQELRMAVL